jgi:hypothetical protein
VSPFVAVVIGAAVLVVILVMISRSRRSNDGVDSFRRQIDALSPEARRPVIDQMYGNSGREHGDGDDDDDDKGDAHGA